MAQTMMAFWVWKMVRWSLSFGVFSSIFALCAQAKKISTPLSGNWTRTEVVHGIRVPWNLSIFQIEIANQLSSRTYYGCYFHALCRIPILHVLILGQGSAHFLRKIAFCFLPGRQCKGAFYDRAFSSKKLGRASSRIVLSRT